MRYIKLFEGIDDDGYEVVFDPHTYQGEWAGIGAYLCDKRVVQLQTYDTKKIVDFISQYIPMSYISMPTGNKLEYNSNKFDISLKVITMGTKDDGTI